MKLLKLKDAADLIGIGYKRARKMCQNGELPSVRVSTRPMIPEEEIVSAMKKFHIGQPFLLKEVNQIRGFVRAADLAEMIGVTRMTIDRWARDAKIPHYRVSDRIVKYCIEEIEQWQKNNTTWKQ